MNVMNPIDAEARAWRVLLASFATFVVLCGLIVYAAQWFAFQSVIPLKATLTVARGTVRIIVPSSQEPLAVTDVRTDIEAGTSIQTDASSQAVVTFYDPSTSEPLAALVVFRDSRIKVTRMSAPQFGLNQSPFQIEITGELGRGQARIITSLNGKARIILTTNQ